ncbi:DUF222 domain-containing protein [Pseudonocardia sp. CA-107938]|uniref:HNH endonuclease n=1 Tax=Pseudonocardia sp. CA-107938 TaxID=3240021 RepID=UPI003D9100AF
MSRSAELIERVSRIDRSLAALAAERAEAVREFAQVHVAEQIETGEIGPERLEQSVVAQVALACRVSPSEARKRLHVARDLHEGLDRVRELFAAGELSEHKVAVIVAATAHLSRSERAWVDEQLAERGLERLGVGRLGDLARKLAAEVAPEKFLERCREARGGRRVTIRPALDGMADLTAHLPVPEAVACFAALKKAVDEVFTAPDPVTRSRSQIMADTLVERVTGQAVATDVGFAVNVTVPVESLVDPVSPLPAEIPGYGPVPVWWITSGGGRKAWRRLVTKDGVVIGGDSRQRAFTGSLAAFIRAREGNRCSEPYCDAPVRHIDHIERYSEGGRTEFDNGRGLCEFHNYVRENPDWDVYRAGDVIVTTTPTGASYVADVGSATRKIRAPHRMRPSRSRAGPDGRRSVGRLSDYLVPDRSNV